MNTNPDTHGVSKVVVGVDGSRTSAAAGGWAARLAAATGSELVAVTAWRPDQAELPPETDRQLEDEVRGRLESWCAPVRDTGVRLRTAVVEGEPERLGAVADEEDADVLVVGTHGLGGFTPLHLGSLTRHLASRVRRPLALIPDPRDDDDLTEREISTIALCVDESAGTEAAARFCASIAPALGASVIALTVEDPESTDQDGAEWMAPLRASGTATEVLARDHGDAAEGLLDLAGRVQLIVVGAEGLSSVVGLRLGGTAMHLLDQTKVPMVIVPPGTSTGPHEHHRHEPDVRSGGGV